MTLSAANLSCSVVKNNKKPYSPATATFLCEMKKSGDITQLPKTYKAVIAMGVSHNKPKHIDNTVSYPQHDSGITEFIDLVNTSQQANKIKRSQSNSFKEWMDQLTVKTPEGNYLSDSDSDSDSDDEKTQSSAPTSPAQKNTRSATTLSLTDPDTIENNYFPTNKKSKI